MLHFSIIRGYATIILTCHYEHLYSITHHRYLFIVCKIFVLHSTTKVIIVQACHVKLVLLNNIWNFDRLMAVLSSQGLFLTYVEMDMNPSGMGTPEISVQMVWYYSRV